MKFIFSLLLLFVSRFSFAQTQIQFQEITLAEALQKSRTDHKPVFLECFESWCTHCNKMKEEVFTDSSVAAFYNSNFICIQQDLEKGNGPAMHLMFAVKAFPTFIFLDSINTTLYRMVGEFKAADLIEQGKNALNPEKQLPTLKNIFESDIT
ncbi:MAG: DUF255 domain-containing protein, partial [Chitinophagales bacterium]|nr:DUF255 domain-containing protein [Chitinophagales bacterium]